MWRFQSVLFVALDSQLLCLEYKSLELFQTEAILEPAGSKLSGSLDMLAVGSLDRASVYKIGCSGGQHCSVCEASGQCRLCQIDYVLTMTEDGTVACLLFQPTHYRLPLDPFYRICKMDGCKFPLQLLRGNMDSKLSHSYSGCLSITCDRCEEDHVRAFDSNRTFRCIPKPFTGRASIVRDRSIMENADFAVRIDFDFQLDVDTYPRIGFTTDIRQFLTDRGMQEGVAWLLSRSSLYNTDISHANDLNLLIDKMRGVPVTCTTMYVRYYVSFSKNNPIKTDIYVSIG